MNVRVETVVMEESVEIAKEAEKRPRSYYSRGATTATLKECNLTILDMYENNLEILKRNTRSHKIWKKNALIWYNEIPYKDLLYNLLQIKVNFYRYKNQE